MKTRNKINRQQSWVKTKKTKTKSRLELRHERRKEEDKYPELRAERLAKNKPVTLEDKRIWPVSEDDWARRKRRKVEAPVEEKGYEEDDMEVDGEEDKEDAKEDDDEAEDSDGMSSFIGDDSDSDEEDEGGDENKEQKTKSKTEDTTEADAVARAAHEDAMAAKYAGLLSGPPPDEPRILVTTSRHSTLHRQAKTLVDLFPNSTYIPRSGHKYVRHEYSIREIAGYAHNRGYTALLVLNEDQKKPSGLDITLLPNGPMLHFSIQTWVDAKRLPNHGRSTGHVPEVLLNNFVTPLGKLVGGVLGRLYPQAPELVGRQVVTLHNQRDFVFVRRHRYAVRDKRATERSVADAQGKTMAGVEDVRVALQEIGPRMTLKLRRVDKGIQHMSGQAFEWKGRMDKKRTLWQL